MENAGNEIFGQVTSRGKEKERKENLDKDTIWDELTVGPGNGNILAKKNIWFVA